MKFLVFLLIVAACGKQNAAKTNFYQVDPASIGEDSDGDGMLDWDEIAAKRDPHLADLDQSIFKPQEEVTLITEKGEIGIKSNLYRTQRKSILEKIQNDLLEIPDENFWVAQLNHQQDYWKTKLSNILIKQIRLTSEDNLETHLATDASIIKSGSIAIRSKMNNVDFTKIRAKTYRLIISTPEGESNYYLSPSVDPKEFLERNHKTVFDHNGNLIGIDQSLQIQPHPYSRNFSGKQSFWVAIGWGLNLNKKANIGDTLVLAFATVSEINGHSGIDQKNFDFKEVSYHAPVNERVSFLVHIPSTETLSWEYKDETITWTLSGGGREGAGRDASCTFRRGKERGMVQSSVNSAQDFLSILQVQGVSDLKVEWFFQSDAGSVAQVSAIASQDSVNLNLNPNYINETKPIGIFKSNCGTRMSSNFTNKLVRPTFTSDLYWNTLME